MSQLNESSTSDHRTYKADGTEETYFFWLRNISNKNELSRKCEKIFRMHERNTMFILSIDQPISLNVFQLKYGNVIKNFSFSQIESQRQGNVGYFVDKSFCMLLSSLSWIN